MGCGCGSKRDPPAYLDPAKPGHALEVPNSSPVAGNNTSVHNLASVMPSVLEATSAMETICKCPQCEDPDLKKHVLDCSHGLCANCANSQLEDQMRKKQQGNIMFFCKICKAPKNLSNDCFVVNIDRTGSARMWLLRRSHATGHDYTGCCSP